MKRYQIWKKGDFFHPIDDNRYDMDPSVVELPKDCPLLDNFDYMRPIGLMKNLEFEDGEITGELHVFDPVNKTNIEKILEDEDTDSRLGGYYTKVECQQDAKDNWYIIGAQLRGVSIIHNPVMPDPEGE